MYSQLFQRTFFLGERRFTEILSKFHLSFQGLSWHPWKSSLLCVGTSNGHLALLNTSLGKCIHSKRESNTIIYEVTFNKLSGELVVSQTYCESGKTYSRLK